MNYSEQNFERAAEGDRPFAAFTVRPLARLAQNEERGCTSGEARSGMEPNDFTAQASFG
jgi:hypothetical protein